MKLFASIAGCRDYTMRTSVLVLCDGNLCRSPMARAVLASCLPELEVDTAGLAAVVGRRADPAAVALLSNRSISIDDHIAKQLSWSMAKKAEVIFVMTEAQKHVVEGRYPFSKGKVFRIGHHGGFDIIDPFGREHSAFESALSNIEIGLTEWLPALRAISASTV